MQRQTARRKTMFDIIGNALIAWLTWIGGLLGLELFDMLMLLAAIGGAWLFLLRAQMYVGLAQSRKRYQRKQRRQGSKDQKQQQATDDANSAAPVLATADADDADDDPPLLRSHAPNVHRVAVQPAAAPAADAADGDDAADADADNQDAPWLNRTGPVSDPQPVPAPSGDDADPDPANAVANAVAVTGVMATGERLLDLL
jgi:predicted lipid-binding transport protein (Tim44 family)